MSINKKTVNRTKKILAECEDLCKATRQALTADNTAADLLAIRNKIDALHYRLHEQYLKEQFLASNGMAIGSTVYWLDSDESTSTPWTVEAIKEPDVVIRQQNKIEIVNINSLSTTAPVTP